VNIQRVLFWLECTSLRLWSCNGIVNNAVFHSRPEIHQTLPQIIPIVHFYLGNSLLSPSGVWPALLADCQLMHRSHIFLSVCLCTSAINCYVFDRYFVFPTSYSVMYLVFLLPSFTRKLSL